MRSGFINLIPVGLAALMGMAASAPAQSQVTFTKDIAPILQRSCQNCHRPESMAPMSLLTYKDVRPWARSIKNKVLQREMPPWFLDKTVGVREFKDDPSLSDKEIAISPRGLTPALPKGIPPRCLRRANSRMPISGISESRI